MRINLRRGAFRLWVLASVLWCAGIIFVTADTMNVASPFAAPHMVHVKFSNTETWDYPAEWGVERIGAALKKRVQELDQKEHAWIATVPESRKAECRAIPSATPSTDQPADCVRMAWDAVVDFESGAVPSGWENQVRDAPMSMWQAIAKLLPLAGGPPILVLALGYALFWALAGFRGDS
jgi:hypothetical protein